MGKVHTPYDRLDAEAFTFWKELAQWNKTALAELKAQQIELGRSVFATGESFISAMREAKMVTETVHGQSILLRESYTLGVEAAQKAGEWFDEWTEQFLACWKKHEEAFRQSLAVL